MEHSRPRSRRDKDFLSAVVKFMSQKANLFYRHFLATQDQGPRELAQQEELCEAAVGSLVPVESLMGLPANIRRQHFYQTVAVSDVVIGVATGTLTSAMDSGMLGTLLFVDMLSFRREISDLGITVFCPSEELPHSREYVLQPNDLFRGVVTKVDRERQRLTVSLQEQDTDDAHSQGISISPMGLITAEDIPARYRRRQKRERGGTVSNRGPSAASISPTQYVAALQACLGLSHTASLFSDLHRAKVPEGEFADQLSQAQADRQAKWSTSRGKEMLRQGRQLQALQHFNEALSADPCYAEALIGRGVLHAGSACYLQAMEDFEAVHKADPCYSQAKALLTEVKLIYALRFEEDGMLEEAEEGYEELLEVDPGNVLARRGVERCRWTRLDKSASVLHKDLDRENDKHDTRADYQRHLLQKRMAKLKELMEAEINSQIPDIDDPGSPTSLTETNTRGKEGRQSRCSSPPSSCGSPSPHPTQPLWEELWEQWQAKQGGRRSYASTSHCRKPGDELREGDEDCEGDDVDREGPLSCRSSTTSPRQGRSTDALPGPLVLPDRERPSSSHPAWSEAIDLHRPLRSGSSSGHGDPLRPRPQLPSAGPSTCWGHSTPGGQSPSVGTSASADSGSGGRNSGRLPEPRPVLRSGYDSERLRPLVCSDPPGDSQSLKQSRLSRSTVSRDDLKSASPTESGDCRRRSHQQKKKCFGSSSPHNCNYPPEGSCLQGSLSPSRSSSRSGPGCLSELCPRVSDRPSGYEHAPRDLSHSSSQWGGGPRPHPIENPSETTLRAEGGGQGCTTRWDDLSSYVGVNRALLDRVISAPHQDVHHSDHTRQKQRQPSLCDSRRKSYTETSVDRETRKRGDKELYTSTHHRASHFDKSPYTSLRAHSPPWRKARQDEGRVKDGETSAGHRPHNRDSRAGHRRSESSDLTRLGECGHRDGRKSSQSGRRCDRDGGGEGERDGQKTDRKGGKESTDTGTERDSRHRSRHCREESDRERVTPSRQREDRRRRGTRSESRHRRKRKRSSHSKRDGEHGRKRNRQKERKEIEDRGAGKGSTSTQVGDWEGNTDKKGGQPRAGNPDCLGTLSSQEEDDPSERPLILAQGQLTVASKWDSPTRHQLDPVSDSDSQADQVTAASPSLHTTTVVSAEEGEGGSGEGQEAGGERMQEAEGEGVEEMAEMDNSEALDVTHQQMGDDEADVVGMNSDSTEVDDPQSGEWVGDAGVHSGDNSDAAGESCTQSSSAVLRQHILHNMSIADLEKTLARHVGLCVPPVRQGDRQAGDNSSREGMGREESKGRSNTPDSSSPTTPMSWEQSMNCRREAALVDTLRPKFNQPNRDTERVFGESELQSRSQYDLSRKDGDERGHAVSVRQGWWKGEHGEAPDSDAEMAQEGRSEEEEDADKERPRTLSRVVMSSPNSSSDSGRRSDRDDLAPDSSPGSWTLIPQHSMSSVTRKRKSRHSGKCTPGKKRDKIASWSKPKQNRRHGLSSASSVSSDDEKDLSHLIPSLSGKKKKKPRTSSVMSQQDGMRPHGSNCSQDDRRPQHTLGSVTAWKKFKQQRHAFSRRSGNGVDTAS